MTFLQFLSHAEPSVLFSLFAFSPLAAFKYSGLIGLLILMTGAAGLLLARSAFKGVRVYPWRAFLTLGGGAFVLGWLGAYWGYVGVLRTLDHLWVRPTDAQLAGGAVQAWTTIVWGSGVALCMVGAGALVARHRKEEEPAPQTA